MVENGVVFADENVAEHDLAACVPDAGITAGGGWRALIL